MLNYIIRQYIKNITPGKAITTIQKHSNTDTINLGRWNRLTCEKLLNDRIDRSNNDHCGPCGYYKLEKIDETNNSK